MRIWICIAFAWLSLSCTAALGEGTAAFPLEAVISVVKREIAAAQSVVIGEPRFVLKNVVIELSISEVTDKKGSLSIGVPFYDTKLSGSGSSKRQSVSKLTVELKPPKPVVLSAGAQLGDMTLARYIVEARKQLQTGLREEPYLEPVSLTLNVEFGVTKKLGGGGGIKLIVFSADGKYEHSSSDASKIKLSFSLSKVQ